MKIIKKKKFMVRVLEILVIIATIVLTILSINYATKIRGYKAYGGEYLIPILGLIVLFILEEIHDSSEERKE